MTGKNKKISPQDWITLLEQHHSYIKKCPGEIIARFDADETGRLACAQPVLATQLNLNSLSKEQQDKLLQKHPALAVFFTFTQNDPPGKLVLSHFLDNCNEEEIKIAAPFLANLFPFLTLEETTQMADEGDGLLGVFTQTKGVALQTQINSFLKEKKISPAALEALWKPMQLPLFKPVDNLEIQILEKHTGKITEACMEEEKLSRPDIIWHQAFADLPQEVEDLILLKAASPALRQKALEKMMEEDAPFIMIEHLKAVCSFAPQPHSKHEEFLLEAVDDKEFKVVDALAGVVSFNFLSVDEVIHIFRTLPDKLAQKFFDKAIPPLLRAYLLTELSGPDHTPETVKIVNMLLRTVLQNNSAFPDEEYISFSI